MKQLSLPLTNQPVSRRPRPTRLERLRRWAAATHRHIEAVCKAK